MKKIILHSLFFATCISLCASCTKQVKVPASKVSASTITSKTTTTTTTSTSSQTQNPYQGHSCSGGNSH